jgi:AraC family transcriptional regulator, transcriptional activator of pobA
LPEKIYSDFKLMNEIPKISFFKSQNKEIGFEILTLKSLFSRQGTFPHPLDKPQRVDFYHILFITKGDGRHYIDFREYEYTKGSILFISTGQVHAFEFSPGVEGFLLLFTDAFLSKNIIHSDLLSFSRLYNYHLHLPVIQPEESSENFNNIFNDIYDEYISSDAFAKEEMLRLLLKLLLLKAERIKRTLMPNEKNSEWFIKFGKFKNLVEKYFSETRNAKDYAGMMDISYNHLNKITKSITGNTAKVFIDHFLILEIKRQLAVSDISIKELTYELGFDEPTNFVKYFKKRTHLSPSQFKKYLKK